MGKGSQEGRVMQIVLVDDQELIRFSIRSVLSREEDIEVVGEASTGRGASGLSEQFALADVLGGTLHIYWLLLALPGDLHRAAVHMH